MEKTNKNLWLYALRIGLVAGIALLYLGAVGMLSVFNERELVRDLINLGQVLLLIPTVVASIMISQKFKESSSDKTQTQWVSLLATIAAAIIVVLPSLLILALGEMIDIRSMFVNFSRDWIEVITLDNRNALLRGSFLLTLASIVTAIIITFFSFLPIRVRKGLSLGVSISLLVAMFGETLRLILQESLPKDAMDFIFRRSTMKQTPFFLLLAITTSLSLVWAFNGDRVRKRYSSFTPKQQITTVRIWQSLGIALLLALPWLIGRSLSDVAVTVGLFILMGLGLNIAIGLAGLLDLGYVTNYAVGAYVLAVLTSTSAFGRGGEVMNFWIVIPIAILCAMFAGFIFAVPVLKMRGDYLAIATLGFGEIIGKLAISDWLKPVIGGAQGILFIPKPNFFGLELKNPEQLYYLVLVACIVTLFVSIRLNNSRIGRQWMAIREDEDVALAMGIDTARSKLLAFTLSAATGGIAGAIFAAKVGTVFPKSFIVLVSINVLSLIIVGGMGSNIGIIIGALALIGLPELLREFSEFRWLLYGALLIFMMIRKPDGFIPSKVRQRELQDPNEQATA